MSGGAAQAAAATGRSLLVLRRLVGRRTREAADARPEAAAAFWASSSSSSSSTDDGEDDRLRRLRDERGGIGAASLLLAGVGVGVGSGAAAGLFGGTRRSGLSPHGLAAASFLQQQHHHPFDARGLTTTTSPHKSDESGAPPTTAATTTLASKHSLGDVQGLLDSLSALRLREELNAASDATPYIPHARLLEIVRETGAADTAAEAERVADALVRAGVVLRLGGVVYLRPHEVAEMVLASVPSDGTAAAHRLRDIERELELLDRAHADIVAQARRWPRFWLGAGCAAFAAQLAGFIYLCYWELSWDVVEPLACFVSMGWTLVAWLYFLARGSALDYDAFDSHWTQQGLERRMAALGFDPERHEQLAMARDRYRRYLTAQRAAALAGGVPAGGVVSSLGAAAAAGAASSAVAADDEPGAAAR